MFFNNQYNGGLTSWHFFFSKYFKDLYLGSGDIRGFIFKLNLTNSMDQKYKYIFCISLTTYTARHKTNASYGNLVFD